MSLWSMFLNHRGRPIHKWAHYFPAYERHLAKYINSPVLFIEIGCGEGGSLQLWKKYLGPYARIVGIDIRPECRQFEEDQISVRIGKQEDTTFLQNVLEEFGSPDVVLDDGSHIMDHIQSTFRFLYSRVSLTGTYIIEDLHTAHWDEFGGGLRKAGTFVEVCKELIDEINAENTRGAVLLTEFSRSTLSMHVYNSLVVFERGRTPSGYDLITGDSPRLG
jgi:cephalosporin hydroxylase